MSNLVEYLTGARDKFVDMMQKAEHFGQKHLSQPVFGPKKKLLRMQQAGKPAKGSMDPETKDWKSMKKSTKR